MPAPGTLDVVHVDGAVADRGQRVLAEAELVDRVGVEVDGEVVAVGSLKGTVDHGWGRAEVLVDLDPERPARDRFLDGPRVGGAAAEKAEIEAVVVGGA